MRFVSSVLAALVVANMFVFEVGAQDREVIDAGMVRRMNVHEDQDRVVHAGMVRQYKALQRQVAGLKRQHVEAEKALVGCEEKAVKSGRARSQFVARLGACIGKLREVKNLSEQVKKDEVRLSDLDGRMDAIEDRVGLLTRVVQDHEERLGNNETRTWESLRRVEDLLENGPEFAFLVGSGVTRGGVPLNLGFGLGLPVSNSQLRSETEVLIGLRPEHLAFTVRERVRQAGDGLALGGNVMFLAQARTDLTAAREVLLGVGPSIGWSGERFGVTLDLAGGPDRVARHGWKFGGSAGLTLAVKF